MVAMTDRAATAGPHTNVTVMLHVNGHAQRLPLHPRVTLLDALRDYLHLTGTKKGYDRGACGACTVLLDGRSVLSCLTPAVQCDDRAVTTMEGLAPEGGLHPRQLAFIRHDAFQCGCGIAGQAMSAAARLWEGRAGSDGPIVSSSVGASRIQDGGALLGRSRRRARRAALACALDHGDHDTERGADSLERFVV